MNRNKKIALIGLGYVGLPLAIEFGKKYKTTGFDVNTSRISELNKKIDKTLEVTSKEIKESKHLSFSSEEDSLKDCNVYIITVPTPIDEYKRPDFSALISASKIIGRQLHEGNIVIYESTVYPGATEEVCVPILEEY